MTTIKSFNYIIKNLFKHKDKPLKLITNVMNGTWILESKHNMIIMNFLLLFFNKSPITTQINNNRKNYEKADVLLDISNESNYQKQFRNPIFQILSNIDIILPNKIINIVKLLKDKNISLMIPDDVTSGIANKLGLNAGDFVEASNDCNKLSYNMKLDKKYCVTPYYIYKHFNYIMMVLLNYYFTNKETRKDTNHILRLLKSYLNTIYRIKKKDKKNKT